MTTPAAGPVDTRVYVYDLDHRIIGEYGPGGNGDVRAEYIWALPEVGASGLTGGDDGAGGYMPLAVVVGLAIQASFNAMDPWDDFALPPSVAGPDCSNWAPMENRRHPPGYWDTVKGAEEWGRRNGVGKDEGRRRFHDIKGDDNPSRGRDNFGVNSETGDVMDLPRDSVGNLND